MATTPNLGLPLIDSAMTADVPRDFNALANAVDTAVEEAVADVTIPDASLTVKGKVQLTNATNSTSETLAPTAKAVNDARVAAALDATTKANAAETNAKNASLPRAGGAISGRLNVQTWSTISGSIANGWSLYGVNCYLDGTTLKYESTHNTIGARGILMRYPEWSGTEIYMFDTGPAPTTAGGSFTPTLKRIANTDDFMQPGDNPTTNFIRNSTGLFGLDGWSNAGTYPFYSVADNRDVGGLFYVDEAVPANQYAVLDSAVINAYPGEQYDLQAMFFTLVTYANTIVHIEVKNVATGDSLFALAGDPQKWWHRKKMSFTIPAGVAQIRLRLVVTNAPAGTKGISRIRLNLRHVVNKDVPYDFTGEMVHVANELSSVKQSGVDAKNGIVGAIIANGGSASTSDAWAVLAQKVQTLSSFKPGTYNLYTSDGSNGTSSTGYAKVRSFQPSVGGTFRVSHRFSVDSSITGASGYSRWYVNDVPVGMERYVSNNGTQTFEEDITLKQGDVLQLFLRSTTSQNNVYASDVRFKIAFAVTVS